MYMSTNVPVHQYIRPSSEPACQCTCPSIYLSVKCTCPSNIPVYQCTCPSMYLPFNIPVRQCSSQLMYLTIILTSEALIVIVSLGRVFFTVELRTSASKTGAWIRNSMVVSSLCSKSNTENHTAIWRTCFSDDYTIWRIFPQRKNYRIMSI